jgi:hypothetical protein
MDGETGQSQAKNGEFMRSHAANYGMSVNSAEQADVLLSANQTRPIYGLFPTSLPYLAAPQAPRASSFRATNSFGRRRYATPRARARHRHGVGYSFEDDPRNNTSHIPQLRRIEAFDYDEWPAFVQQQGRDDNPNLYTAQVSLKKQFRKAPEPN